MLTHIVLFKLKDKSEENIQKTKEVLQGLKGKVPFLKFIEVGTDILHSERSYDVGLYTKFDSLADMQSYKVHPVHVKVSEHMHAVMELSVAIDYES
ncbi:MAG TPA: Dabb family protein [Ruminiclostridium sp.]